MKPEDSIASLKETLEGVSGIAVQQQLLIHNGRELQSRYTKLPAAVDINQMVISCIHFSICRSQGMTARSRQVQKCGVSAPNVCVLDLDMCQLYVCSSTMAASSVQEQDLVVLARRPPAQASQQPQQQQATTAAADPLQARMQQAMRTRPDGSLENPQARILGSNKMKLQAMALAVCAAIRRHS